MEKQAVRATSGHFREGGNPSSSPRAMNGPGRNAYGKKKPLREEGVRCRQMLGKAQMPMML
jgi:hypothetical protein